jgi:hypothetical protein
VELGQLVEKEHAEMGECHFARKPLKTMPLSMV